MSNNRYEISTLNPSSIISAFMDDPFFSVGFSDFASVPSKVSNSICSNVYPKSDIYTTEDGSMHIECAVAGYSEDEISAEYKDNYITISLQKTAPTEKRNYLQGGIKYSTKDKSTCSFYIDPTYYDADQAKVKLENGIFSIVCPRSERLAKNRKLFGKEEPKVVSTEEKLKKKEKQ